MNVFLQDIRYGFRVLMKKPAFTAIAVLSLALGIGINTAIFTLINTILLGSLPYPEPDRVVAIWTVPPQHSDQLQPVSVPDFIAWRDDNRTFDALGVMTNNVRDFGAEQNGFPAERIQGEDVSPGVLQALGAQPLMGRLFQSNEDEVDHPAPVAIISYRLWRRRFGADPEILNRSVLLNGIKSQIIGVMAPNFRITDDDADYWAPMRFNSFQLRGSARFMMAIGRIRRGVSIQQAQTDMDSIAARLARDFPKRDTDHGKPWGVKIQPVREALFGFMSRPLLLLQGAVGFVLLIACANVAALLLARASSRYNEIAVRSALGASRGRIVRQCLTESVLLSLMGGVIGVLMAWWGVRALVAMAPSWFPRLHEIGINRSVLWFSAGLSLLTGLIFGVGPAIQGSHANLIDALRDAARGGTSGATRHRLRGVLVTLQVAMALVLLIGAGLLIRSFARIEGADLGCDPRGVLTFGIHYPPAQFSKPVSTYQGLPLWEVSPVPAESIQRIYERIQAVPGVVSAAGTLLPPFIGALELPFTIEGRPAQDTDALSAEFNPITPNFFATMKIPVLRGRDFTDRDTQTGPQVVIINETMAHRFWPNEDPLGKRLKIDLSPDDQPREVVAIVHDTPSSRTQTRQNAAMYIPFRQMGPRIIGPYSNLPTQLTLVMRTLGEPMSLMPAMRKAVSEIDSNRPLVDPKTVEQYMAEQVQYPRYYSMLLGLFAAVAMVLAAVGIYGVMAFAVEQRTREIGIRMALGAGGWDVLTLVVRQALVLIAGGMVLGLAGASALTRYISSQLWEVTATDPITFGVVTFLLASVAVAACLIPTLRAVRVDPTIALRYE
ncbi:MAG TPA: ABC transporter permease [Bryobacteraceae bacterium]|nr:ABC transporter permease [Bryobacteraceae bacterium]